MRASLIRIVPESISGSSAYDTDLSADHHRGVWLPGALVADTLEELTALLPRGLTREDRAPLDPPGVVEVWS